MRFYIEHDDNESNEAKMLKYVFEEFLKTIGSTEIILEKKENVKNNKD